MSKQCTKHCSGRIVHSEHPYYPIVVQHCYKGLSSLHIGLDNVLTNDLAIRRSIPGLPGRAVVYEGKHIDDSDLESVGAGQFTNDKLEHYLAVSADEMDS